MSNFESEIWISLTKRSGLTFLELILKVIQVGITNGHSQK